MINTFKNYLTERNFAPNTIKAYIFAIQQFHQHYSTISPKTLSQYKCFMLDRYKPQTINLRLRAVNFYLEFIGKAKWQLSLLKVQQSYFLDNVISEENYTYFKQKLKKDGKQRDYFVIHFLASTGMRISELIQIRYQHIEQGYADLCSKRNKIRRIYIPTSLQQECLNWLNTRQEKHDFLFLNRFGKPISTRGISAQLKAQAKHYKIPSTSVYPHSFRHRFAKSFLTRLNDISLLADLLGHENIQTTRIYLRRTNEEQKALINKIVDW